MDEADGQPAATPVVKAQAKLNENQNMNSKDSSQKPESAGKVTLTDLWKKAKKKDASERPAGDVDVIVLDDPIEETADREGNDLSSEKKAEPRELAAGPVSTPVSETAPKDGPVNEASGAAVGDVSGSVEAQALLVKTSAVQTTSVQPKKPSAKSKRGRSKKSSSKKVELVTVGTLHVQKGWFNSGYIFPIGFKSRTQFRSSVDLDGHCMHECEVIGEGGQFWPKPTFRVVGADRPEEPLVGKSPTACWTAVQKRINGEIERRRAAGEDLPPAPKTAIAGTEYFGFNHDSVVAAIEALDVERKAVEYWAGREAEKEIEAVEAEMKECVEVYAQQNSIAAVMRAKPAVSCDDSVVTEDAEDMPVESTHDIDDESHLAKSIVDGMIEAIEITEGCAEASVKVDGGGDVVMQDHTAPVASATPVAPVAAPARPVLEQTEAKATKKRRSFSFDPSTVEDMEALYAKSSVPSKEDKVRLAEKHGIEVKQIESWMGKRRKADRDAANGIIKVKKMPKKKVDDEANPGVSGTPLDASISGTIHATQPKPLRPPRVPLSDDELQAMVKLTREQLEAESMSLKERGLLPPLADLGSLVKAEPTEYSDSRLCYLAVGQRLTLSDLVATVSPMFEDASRPSEDTLRASLALMLERKSADPVNKSVKALERFDWKNAEDLVGGGLWQWEAKNKEHLDKSAGARAVVIKRRAAKVHERLKAISNILSLCDADSVERKEKAVDAFEKATTLAALEEEAEAERMREKLKEDTERLKAEKKQEKERLKAEKEAEKLKAKEEKVAEREQKKVEKEQKKLVEKTGFKDSSTLQKSAKMFKNFFGAKSVATDQEKQGEDDSKPIKKKDGTYYERRFLKPTLSLERVAPTPVALDAALTTTRDHDELVSEFRSSMKAAHAKYMAEQADLKKRCLGLPPSWARKADAVEVAEQNMHQLTSNGLSPESIQTYRRKLIYVKDAYTVRPPFYGSRKPLESNAVGPRRFLGKDPSLDYEVMSDEDWEEEPEGSSLSKDDVMSEEDDVDEDENSFCVGDGYLSADEGIRSDDDGVIPMDAADICTISKGSNSGRLDLLPYLEKSRRSGKPFVLVRGSAEAADANHGACYRGDPALCASLKMEIMLPGARLEVPDLDEDKLVRQQTSEKPAKKDEKDKASLDELLPDLTSYILANAVATKPSLIDGFVEKHKERKLTKKWVGDSISAVASRSGKTWKIKSITKPASMKL